MRRVKVTVRSRPISGDRRTLYLDYYPAVRIPETMKMMRQETLGMYLYDKPKNQIQKRHNESTLAQAEAIRCLRVQAVINEEFGFLDKQRLNTDFLEYFRKETLMRIVVGQVATNTSRHSWAVNVLLPRSMSIYA